MEKYVDIIPLSDSIPKHIHQIFIGGSVEKLSLKIAENIAYIRKLNPDWQYTLYGDAEVETFIRTHYNEEVWKYYKMISPRYRAAQADFFPYLLMYKVGGVYMDIKASMSKPLSEMFTPDDKYVLYHWDNAKGARYEGMGYLLELPTEDFPYGEYPQGFIMCVAGHPILREVILQVMHNLKTYSPFKMGVGLFGVLKTTGPLTYSLTVNNVKKRIDSNLYREVRCAEELGLRVSIFDDDSNFAHRKMYSTYHNQLTAISLNGSQYWTALLYPYFYLRRVCYILRDKWRMRIKAT